MFTKNIVEELIQIKTGMQLDNIVELIFRYYRTMVYNSYNIFELAQCYVQQNKNSILELNKNKMINDMLTNDIQYNLRSSYYRIIDNCIHICDACDACDAEDHKIFMQIREGDRYTLDTQEYTIMHITDDEYFCNSGAFCIVVIHKNMHMQYIYTLSEFMNMLYNNDITYIQES